MSPSNRSTPSSQFSIKRLFWTMIVASAAFKLADMLGLLSAYASMWEMARGNNRVVVMISIIAFTVIAIVYIGWIGIRLPYLIEQRLAVKKKRQQRNSEYLELIETVHGDKAK